MHRSLRFCQPVGCALITLALIEWACSGFWLILQYSSLEQKYFTGSSGPRADYYTNILWHFLIVLRFLLTLILWGGIIMGKNVLMVFWLIMSFLSDAGVVAFVIFEKFIINPAPAGSSQLSVWRIEGVDHSTSIIFSLSAFVLIRIYLLLVGLQGSICLHRKYDSSQSRSIGENISDIDVCLEPIGYWLSDLWGFFKDLPAMGSKVLLASELVWNIQHLVFRELFAFLLEKSGRSLLEPEISRDVVDYVFLEDNIMRLSRIFLAIVGLYFIHKERLNFVRFWILIYLISLISSNVIFALSVMVQGTTWIVFHAICNVSDNLFRMFVLYFTFKFAIVHRRTIVKS